MSAELNGYCTGIALRQKNHASAPAQLLHVKAVEISCVTCGGAIRIRNCPATSWTSFIGKHFEYVVTCLAAANYKPRVRHQFRSHGCKYIRIQEYSQEVRGFTDIIASGNSPRIMINMLLFFPYLTPFGDSDFPASRNQFFVDEKLLRLHKELLSPSRVCRFLEGNNSCRLILLELDVEENPSL
ncbi:hypothetical protein Tco_1409528 [Tanacetum coccineum]